MNKFDAYIADYLYENKEVALDKIGTFKTLAFNSTQDELPPSVSFEYNKKTVTSEGLINFIAEKAVKNKYLITSDIESHLAQAREFINIGKSYEIPGVGFIKANKTGVYEFLPYSETNKPANQGTQPVKHTKTSSRSAIQLITFLIVIAILAGLGWEAYQLFSKTKASDATNINSSVVDTVANTSTKDSNKNNKPAEDTNTIKPQQPVSYQANDTVNIKYIFETTASLMRAQTRTAQLKSFGNKAGYDSIKNNDTTFYSLYILKPTRLADTLTVKDSISKFLQKDIKLKIVHGTL